MKKGTIDMKAVIAIDSLKGSLSSLQAGDAIRSGILRVYKDAVVQVRPLADGGEGTVEALTIGMGGELQTGSVTGPLGKKIEAQYGILADGVTAIVEMSAAAGKASGCTAEDFLCVKCCLHAVKA